MFKYNFKFRVHDKIKHNKIDRQYEICAQLFTVSGCPVYIIHDSEKGLQLEGAAYLEYAYDLMGVVK